MHTRSLLSIRILLILSLLLGGLIATPAAAAEAVGYVLVEQVWEDIDMNGLQLVGPDGMTLLEPIFGGVQIHLYRCGESTPFITGETNFYNGQWNPGALPAGDYELEFVAPAGYVFTLQNVGTNDELDSDADPITGHTGCFTLSGNTKKWDAGIYKPVILPAGLGDFLWEDANNNGIQDIDEPGIPDQPVTLYNCADNSLADSTTTGANGEYAFNGLAPGAYKVVFTALYGYQFSPQDQGSDDALDSDVDAIGETGCVTLASGEFNPTIDGGVFKPAPKPAALGNFAWLDLNNNGIQDEAGTGIADVMVELYTCTGELMDSMATDANGYYLFSDLVPGDYFVKFTTPSGLMPSLANQGMDDEMDSDAGSDGSTSCVTLAPGDTNLSLDAGFYKPAPLPASIGDRVWLDTDKDGVQDDGENGFANVTVKLYACGGDLIATATTNAIGFYSFTDLTPGSYSVQFVLPGGFTFSPMNVGNDAFDSDADANGMTECTTLEPGENDVTWDAGIYKSVCAPGTGTPGYWKNHPEAWPVSSIVIGGRTYTKAQAISWMGKSEKGDKTITLFRALVAAKLNVLIGNNSTCINSTITAADAWMAAHPVGSKVKASSAAWRTAGPLAVLLDRYNNGLLCAPHRG